MKQYKAIILIILTLLIFLFPKLIYMFLDLCISGTVAYMIYYIIYTLTKWLRE